MPSPPRATIAATDAVTVIACFEREADIPHRLRALIA